MKKRFLTLGMVLALLAVMVMPSVAFAANSASQGATTSAATTINICKQDYATAVTTITFPAGAPGAEVSNPSNGTDNQAFGGAGTAKPVVTLVNTAAVQYTIWYNITTFENGVVASEKYVILAKGAACADAAAVDQAVTFDADATTGTTIAATGDDTAMKDLYLKVTLGTVGAKSGTSTLTILGES